MPSAAARLLALLTLLVAAGCDALGGSSAGRIEGEGGLFGVPVAVSGSVAAVAAPYNGSGRVFLYGLAGGSPALEATLGAPGALPVERFGWDLALDGTHLVVTTLDGFVYVYQPEANGAWVRTAELESPPGARRLFGSAAVGGGRIAVNGPNTFTDDQGEQFEDGTVYVFALDEGGQWRLESQLTSPSPQPREGFGRAFAVSGVVVAVGTSRVSTGGGVYVYRRGNDEWRLEADLRPALSEGMAPFEVEDLSLGEDALLVSGDRAGLVDGAFIYRRAGGAWVEEAFLQPSDGALAAPGRNGFFGESVALDGDLALVGATFEAEGRGAVYAFARQPDGSWAEEAKLTAPRRQRSAFFGQSVALDGRTAVVGAPGENGERGAAYVFERVGPGDWRLLGE